MNSLVDYKYQEATDFFDKKEFGNAEKILRELLAENHNDFDVLNFLGIIKLNLKSYNEAIELFERVVELCPHHGMAYYNLGLAYHNINENDSALQSYLRSLEIQPDYLDGMNNIGVIYLNKKDYENAALYFNEALNLEPENEDALNNLLNLNIVQNKFEEAIELLSKISSTKGEKNHFNKMAILTNLGVTKLQQGKNNEAIEMWKKSLAITPDNEITNYNLGHAQLLVGDFKNGWQNYEWRKKRKGFIERKLHRPELIDQDINGKIVLVYDEQGLGDSIQFVRYLKLLKQKNCKTVFECDPRLVYLFNNYKYIDTLIPRQNYDEPVFEYDYQISLLSLPNYFNTDIDTIPFEHSYLEADKELALKLSRLIKSENILNVGIVWSGNSNHTNDKNRSCALENFENIFELKGIRFFSVQKGKALNQLRQKNLPVIDLDSKGLETFAHTAAIIENLDLVISVDTSVAHLAGAMGKPVWLLLPFLPDWRWMLNRNDSPWYPTMKLFRQKVAGDWKDVFENVITELKKIIKNESSNRNKKIESSFEAPYNQSFIRHLPDPSFQLKNLNDQFESKVKTSEKIFLGLASGENFGWGVCSKYLRKELQNFCSIENIEPAYPAEKKIPGILFNALTDVNFNPLFPQRGKINVGYTFFEDSLTEKSIENSNKYDLIFAGSSWCKNKMLESGIYNTDILIQGIDRELFHYTQAKQEDNLFVIFSGGKFELRKGQDLILKAIKILQSKYNDIVLINSWYNYFPYSLQTMKDSKHINFELINGSWEEQMNHVYQINELDSSRIITLPIVPHKKLLDVYVKTDIGLFPNRCEGGTNLVLMEYMASGRPVIASYSSGHTDIINNENSLILTELKKYNIYQNEKLSAEWEEASIEEIVEKIEYAYHNRDVIKNLGKKAAEDMEIYTWNNTAKYLYERLIKL